MLNQTSPAEQVGSTKGEKVIVRNNQNKYEKAMAKPLRKKIEAITGGTLESLGYSIIESPKSYRVSKTKMYLYKLLDGFNLFRTTIKRIGIIEAVKYGYEP